MSFNYPNPWFQYLPLFFRWRNGGSEKLKNLPEFGTLIVQLGLELNSNFKAHVLDLSLLSLISFSSASYYLLFPLSFVCHSYFFLILSESFTHSYKLYFLSWQRGSGLNRNFPSYLLYALPHTWHLSQVELFGDMVFADLLPCHFISLRLSVHYVCVQTSPPPREHAPWGQSLYCFSLGTSHRDGHLRGLHKIPTFLP